MMAQRPLHRSSAWFSYETIERFIAGSYTSLAETLDTYLPVITPGSLARGCEPSPKPKERSCPTCPRSSSSAFTTQDVRRWPLHCWTATPEAASTCVPPEASRPSGSTRRSWRLAEVDLDVTTEFPKPLTDEVVRAADVVITMGCGDACPILPGKKYLDWELPDPAGKSIEEVRPIRDDIDRRVRALLAELTSRER